MRGRWWLRWLPLLLVTLIGLALVASMVGGGPEPGALLTAEELVVRHTPRGGAAEPLTVQAVRPTHDGDRIGIEDEGRAMLRFPDALTVELYRQTAVAVESGADRGRPPGLGVLIGIDQTAPAIVRYRLEAGAVFNTLTAEQAASQRLQITTDEAIITAIGTEFLVYADRTGRATWVVVKAGTVRIQAGGTEVVVGPRQQTWVVAGSAPVSPALPAARGPIGGRFPSVHLLTNSRHDDCELLPLDISPHPCPVTNPLGPPTPTPTRPPTPSVAAPTATRTPPRPSPTSSPTPRPTATATITPTVTRPPGSPTPTPIPVTLRLSALRPSETTARLLPPGDDQVTPPLGLVILGAGFGRDAQVFLEGERLPTTYVSSGELRAEVDHRRLETGARLVVRVVSPSPGGLVTSNPLPFIVNSPAPTVVQIEPDAATLRIKQRQTVVVYGTGFVRDSLVLWNGQPKPTQVRFRRQPPGQTPPVAAVLVIELDDSDVPAYGTYRLEVINPAPQGGRAALTVTLNPPVD